VFPIILAVLHVQRLIFSLSIADGMMLVHTMSTQELVVQMAQLDTRRSTLMVQMLA
jgi:hypothetical protein